MRRPAGPRSAQWLTLMPSGVQTRVESGVILIDGAPGRRQCETWTPPL